MAVVTETTYFYTSNLLEGTTNMFVPSKILNSS